MNLEAMIAELDMLCQQRAVEYPARSDTYTRLSRKLRAFCHQLQSEQSEDWHPDATCVTRAASMKPVFVCGYHKSGTTFIRDLLDGHPSLTMLPADSGLLYTWRQIKTRPLAEQQQSLREIWIHRLVNPTGLPPFWLFGRTPDPYLSFLQYLDYWFEQISASPQNLMTSVANAYHCANPRRSEEARYWVDKRPLQELDVHTLLQLYPEARFIHIIRNPLASLAARKTMSAKRNRPFRLLSQIEEFRRSLRQGLEHRDLLGENQYFIIRYEDILQNPPVAMQNVTQFLGIAYHPCLIQPTINGVPSTSNSAYGENRQQGMIQTNSLNKWRTVLNKTELAQIVDYLQEEGETFGYEWQELHPGKWQQARVRASRLLFQVPRAIWHQLRH